MAILATIALLAIGLFIFFLPVLLIVPILYWLKPKPIPHPIHNGIPSQTTIDAEIVEGKFTVVSATPIEETPRAPSGNET